MDGVSFILELGKKIEEIYREVDERISKFKRKTGKRCIKDCGACCYKNVARMAPIEFIPLAIEIFRRGKTDAYIKLLESRNDGMCVLYMPHDDDPRKGYCSHYNLRAATCRLYGYGLKRNKYGNYELIACDHLRKELSRVESADLSILPDYDSVMVRIFSLYPSLSLSRMHPNMAILAAIDKVSVLSFISKPFSSTEGNGEKSDFKT